MKLWQKEGITTSPLIENFTVGNDKQFDLLLAGWDVLGSLAHVQMLQSVGLLTGNEYDLIETELRSIYAEIQSGNFVLEEGVEDIHSQIEFMLTERIGDTGKKVHSGRSRNDQVLVDIKLYLRNEIFNVTELVKQLFNQWQQLSEQHKDKLLPGYTHMQLAMPSSFGLWFGAYAESLVDDMETMLAAYRVINKNPLGSGAGYGSSFPLNRTLTTELLGFESMNYNVVYAQMTRGKAEKILAMALSNIASTVGRFSMDVCLYMNQNFGFISFPSGLTTGSSIMPHKKNPDVFELIRGKCNRLQALPNELALLSTNLPSGYHRETQLTKEILFPALTELKDCLTICTFMLAHIQVKENILEGEKYNHLFSVEEVNREVLNGMPFRDAYRKVGMEIENDIFHPGLNIEHTHEGSMGNLCNKEIANQMTALLEKFDSNRVKISLSNLLGVKPD